MMIIRQKVVSADAAPAAAANNALDAWIRFCKHATEVSRRRFALPNPGRTCTFRSQSVTPSVSMEEVQDQGRLLVADFA